MNQNSSNTLNSYKIYNESNNNIEKINPMSVRLPFTKQKFSFNSPFSDKTKILGGSNIKRNHRKNYTKKITNDRLNVNG